MLVVPAAAVAAVVDVAGVMQIRHNCKLFDSVDNSNVDSILITTMATTFKTIVRDLVGDYCFFFVFYQIQHNTQYLF